MKKLPDDYQSRKLVYSCITSLLLVVCWLLAGRDHTLYSTLTYSLLGALGIYSGANLGQLHLQSKANPIVNKKK